MKNIKRIILLLFGFFTMFSCEDHPAFDLKPGDAYSEADVFGNIDLTEGLVFQNYNTLEGWRIGTSWWTARCGIENASDEAMFHWKTTRYIEFTAVYPDNVSPASMGSAFEHLWRDGFKYIRNADQFMVKIDDSDVMNSSDEKVVARAQYLKGEMKYLRVRTYFRLINYFGGVPYIEKPFGLGDEYDLARTPYQDIVTSLITEIDEAIELLPSRPQAENTGSNREFGRINKEAAAALKSRILLYAASKLHDPSTQPNGPLFDYNISTKWEDARDAAKAAIDMAEEAGYNLAQTGDDSRAYQDLFVSSSNPELIFGRTYNSSYGTYAQDIGSFGLGIQSLPDFAQGVSGDGFWATSQPSHNLAMSFKKTDGTRLDPTVLYDTTEIYADRDPRFYANLVTDGAGYRGREVEMWIPNGYDSKDRDMPTGGHAAKTGYFMRKFQDESLTIEEVSTTASENRPYPLARLAELYLNYAEALYHTGDEGTARVYLNRVVTRVNMPEITATGEELLQAIKDERMWELCFEGHRFFDIRRWMDTDVLGKDIAGIEWARGTVSGSDTTLDANGPLLAKLVVADIRGWDNKLYYLPIPQEEIDRVSLLEQNPGY